MLGRWQPWHDGHTELFKKAYKITGQVVIMVRDVGGIIGTDVGDGRTQTQDDNPFGFESVVFNISLELGKQGFKRDHDYVILLVPNIVDISYGRGVGYKIEEIELDDNEKKKFLNSIEAVRKLWGAASKIDTDLSK